MLLFQAITRTIVLIETMLGMLDSSGNSSSVFGLVQGLSFHSFLDGKGNAVQGTLR